MADEPYTAICSARIFDDAGTLDVATAAEAAAGDAASLWFSREETYTLVSEALSLGRTVVGQHLKFRA
jgi:hypothetical protein